MAATSINILDGIRKDNPGSGKVVLAARPDIGILKVSVLAPLLVLSLGIIAYLVPLPIDQDIHLGGAVLIAGIGLVGFLCVAVLYEGLSKTVYTLTDEYIQEECGIIYKRVRQIPLGYVRDVTCSQNLAQRMFRLSSIAVSPTNGDKIVVSNIKAGERARDIIWKLVLSRSPGTHHPDSAAAGG